MTKFHVAVVASRPEKVNNRLVNFPAENRAFRTDLVFTEGFVTATCDENGGSREAGTTTWEWR